ncbi:MAG: hypothetical protein WCE90_04810 [Candidatus Zixiibacteriota bacterium]
MWHFKTAFLGLLLVLPNSALGFKGFDISNVSYDIESRLDEKDKSLRGSEIISFKTGERTYSELYFYIYQHFHPSFFSLDSAFVNGKSAKVLIPDIGNKDLLRIPLDDTLAPHSSVEVKLYFLLGFGDDIDEYKAAYWRGDFYFGDCYPKLAEFDWEGAVLPDTTKAIPPMKDKRASACGAESYLEETYERMADYRLKMTLPVRFKIIAPGDCQDTLVNSDGTKTQTYEAKRFPRILWIATTNRELLERDFGDFRVYCYYPPKDRKRAEETVNKINVIREYYSEEFGPFPRPQLKVFLMNLPFYLGGMSGDDMLFLSRGGGILDQIVGSKMTLAHEVSHQWWGDAIACGAGTEGWFAEALACYSAELFCSDHKDYCQDKSLLGGWNDKSGLGMYIYAARGDQDESLRGGGVG